MVKRWNSVVFQHKKYLKVATDLILVDMFNISSLLVLSLEISCLVLTLMFIFILICLFIKVFDIGPEGGDQEIDGDVLIETDEIPYECGARLVLIC